MTPRPRINPDERRAQLSTAAAQVFAERGVAATSVSDIVKAAGVAQGTFYLYFDTKEDVLQAVVGQMIEQLVAMIAVAMQSPASNAPARLVQLIDVLASMEDDPSRHELVDFLHRRENRALHDRLTEHLGERLASIVEEIVTQGVAEGSFDVPDPSAAAWFVLGGLQSAEARNLPPAESAAALREIAVFALRALGAKER